MRLPRLVEPLRHRDFRLWWTGQTISSLGNSVYAVAAPFQVLALGGSPVQLGAVVALTFGVRLVMLLLGGAIVDRAPKRAVILTADLVNGVTVTAVGGLGMVGQLRIEHLYATSLVFGITSSFWIPAVRAMIPELIPKDVLTQGNALRALSRQIGNLTGPVVGGAIVVLYGPPAGLVADGVTFFISFACFLAASSVAPALLSSGSLLGQIRGGFGYTISVAWLWSSILFFALINACLFAPLLVGLPILVRDALAANAAVFGLISAATAAGQIGGTALVGQLRIQRIGVGCYASCALAGLAVAGLGAVPLIPAVVAFAAVNGMAVVMASALWNTALQRNVPRELLGRVASIDDMGGILLAPVAPIAVGLFIQAYGPTLAFVGAGAIAVLLAVAGLSIAPVRALR